MAAAGVAAAGATSIRAGSGKRAMSSILAACKLEFLRMLSLRPVFSVVVVAAAVYAVFYPQPYLNEVLRNVPIAIVDQDGTSTSRELTRLVDAAPDIAVAR